jgi:2-polyprenyl-3-methyl-5-hydroxy-6-metoxy-1,4-benzoquinol methylase
LYLKSALETFAPLPVSERLFIRARLRSAPLEAISCCLVGPRILDVGCGHGLLVALAATTRPDWQVTGIDVDHRKVAWAKRSVGRLSNVTVESTSLDDWAARHPGQADCVAIADVLYLLPPAVWPVVLASVKRALRPGGLLVLKEAEADGSWRSLKTLWQERLMVRLLRRTHASGAVGFVTRQEIVSHLEAAQFQVQSVEVFTNYTTPHVLLTARASAPSVGARIGG